MHLHPAALLICFLAAEIAESLVMNAWGFLVGCVAAVLLLPLVRPFRAFVEDL